MLTKKAEKIFNLKYKQGNETWEEACWRIANYVASAEPDDKMYEWAAQFYQLIYNLIFIPGGRTLANAGTNIKNLLNCFVLPVEDSRESIYETLKNAAEIFAWGGGIGFNFSKLREKGADVQTTGGKASGPLSFMSLFDQTGEVISQASRRGAQIGVLDINHPDIVNFINYKSTPNSRNKRLMEEYLRNLHQNGLDRSGKKYFKILEKTLQDDQLSHFNISVLIDDMFMSSVETDQDWELISPSSQKVVNKVKARDLLDSIANMAWESGDPGVLFYDRTNEDNLVPNLGDLKATNPCVTSDTKIVTVYYGGRTIKELIDRGETDVLVYTFDLEKKLPAVRWMRNLRKTRENVKILEVEFDSGLKVRCTPDHNFITFRGNKIEAQNLKEGQAIRAFSLSIHRDGHLRAHGWVDGKTKHQQVARMVYECVHGEIPKDHILHHKDFDKLNNHVENLIPMTNSDHNRVHYPYRRDGGFYRNHKVVSVKDAGYEDVYNGTVDDFHTYIIADPESVSGVESGIVSANCGEIPLLPYEPCCLGSINLHRVYDEESNSINFELLEYAVRTGIRFLDNVQTLSFTPVEEVNKISKGLRRLGLGVMGWADLLAELEIPYDSQEAKNLAEYLSWFISFFSWLESINLAQEKGAISEPYYIKDKINPRILDKVLHSKFNPNRFNLDEILSHGLRNVSVTSIAPTGTIALLASVNSGIEPFFALAYKRNITEGIGNTAKDYVIEINPILFKKLEKYEYSEEDIEEIKNYILKFGKLEGCPKISDKLTRLFRTSEEISPYDHIDMQASWQRFITNAVSKTINCPEEITPEEIKDIFIYAWNSGLKGITIYRNKSKSFQILNVGVSEES